MAAAIEPIAIYGLPDEYWQTYRGRIDAVTPADAREVAEELILPDQLLCLVVGDASIVRADLEATGIGPLELVSPD